MTTLLLTHPDCEQHEMPRHPERPDRLRSVMSQLKSSGLIDEVEMRLAAELDPASIANIHAPRHYDDIAAIEPAEGLVRIDADTYMSKGSLRASLLAAGACVEATISVLNGDANRAFCAIRPPGHHAEISMAMGFCLFNNIAIAADTALRQPGIDRVAIVDFDVHHCNGTVDIFKDRPEVLVCSSFQEAFYPYRFLDYTNDHIINAPLAAGTGGTEFREAIERRWLPALEAHKPDLLLVSAGFDAHRDDPLGGLNLLEEDYRWVTEQLVAIANQHCQGRIVSTMEGGYDLDALARSAASHLAALL